MNGRFRVFLGIAAVSLALACAHPRAWACGPDEPRTVEVVVALDTSGSMEGLIDAARKRLWEIVNELAKAKPLPRLRVALVSYGNTSYSSEEGWVKIDSGFTDDLDTIYQKLFALRTGGGEEYVARAIQTAVEKLEWSSSTDGLKLIFIAGNEAASQDPKVDVREACRRAIGRGIVVNSIFCGPTTAFEAPLWREVAQLTDGHFATIDIQNGVVETTTPFDEKLSALSTALNGTYVPFGEEGRRGHANQRAQDQNAMGSSPSASAGRAESKASGLYRCDWDLVDRCRDAQFKLEDVKDDQLPEELRKLDPERRKARVAELTAERERLQKEVEELSKRRRAFLDEEQKKSGRKNEGQLDAAVKKAIRRQAEKKGFAFSD